MQPDPTELLVRFSQPERPQRSDQRAALSPPDHQITSSEAYKEVKKR